MVREFELGGLPRPKDHKYSLNRLYAGISHCHPHHDGISVAKIFHAFTTYYDIAAVNQFHESNAEAG